MGTAVVYPDKDAAAAGNKSGEAVASAVREAVRLVNRELPAYAQIIDTEVHGEEFEKTLTAKIKRFLYR